jgi:hypothetical protein
MAAGEGVARSEWLGWLELMWRGRYAKDTFVQPLSSSFNLKATGFHQDRARDKTPRESTQKRPCVVFAFLYYRAWRTRGRTSRIASRHSRHVMAGTLQVKECHFSRLKTEYLPRQARDNYTEDNTKRENMRTRTDLRLQRETVSFTKSRFRQLSIELLLVPSAATAAECLCF